MPRQKDEDDQRAAWAKNLGLFSVVVGDLVGCVGAGAGLGYLLMKGLHAPAWILLPTTMAGLVVAMVRLYKISQVSNENNETEKRE